MATGGQVVAIGAVSLIACFMIGKLHTSMAYDLDEAKKDRSEIKKIADDYTALSAKAKALVDREYETKKVVLLDSGVPILQGTPPIPGLFLRGARDCCAVGDRKDRLKLVIHPTVDGIYVFGLPHQPRLIGLSSLVVTKDSHTFTFSAEDSITEAALSLHVP